MSGATLGRVACAFTLWVGFLGSAPSAADDTPSYERAVAPFLKKYCAGCHNEGEDSPGGLDLRTYAGLRAGGSSGPALVPGQSGESRLIGMLAGTIRPAMPPRDSKQPSVEEVTLVRRWIDAGAHGPSADAPARGVRGSERFVPRGKRLPALSAVAFSPEGHSLAATADREVLLWDLTHTKPPVHLNGSAYKLNALAIHPRGELIAAAGGEPGNSGEVLLWNPAGGEPRRLAGHTDAIYAIAFHPDGMRLVTASYDKLLILWNVATGEQVATLKHHTAPVSSVQFSPDGKTILSGGADQTVKLWNADTGERLQTLSEATKGINAVAFHPQGGEFAAAGIDRTIRIYEWSAGVARLKRGAFAHDSAVLALAYSPDGATLFSASEDRRLKAWDVSTLRERHVYDAVADWPLSIAVNPAGDRLACGLFNGTLALFTTARAERLPDLLSAARDTQAAGSLVARATPQDLPAPTANPPATATPRPNPPAPRLDAITPRSVVRGQKVKLTLSGQNIALADRLFLSRTDLPAVLLPGDSANPNQLQCEIDLPADLEPGLLSLRLHTPLGSTASRNFYVGPFAEVNEAEPNNARDMAQSVELPATLTGSIGVRGDRDVWALTARQDDELVFHLIGPNLGSALQARIRVRDASGDVLATQVRRTGQNDVTLGLKIPREGRYHLEIEDRDNTGGGNHFYLVHAGRFPFVSSLFPQAVRGADQGEREPGEVSELTLTGFNLTGARPVVPGPGIGVRRQTLPTDLGPTLNSIRYEQHSAPQFVEREPNDAPDRAQMLKTPVGVSGRLSEVAAAAPPDVDLFAFDAREGERLTIEVQARRIGSPLDSVLEILDSTGEVLPRQTLRSVAETYTELRDHDSRSKGIRLHSWDDLLPGDLVLLGGELAKVQILPLGPDEDVKFFDRGGLRLGYLGTTPEAHALNRFAYKVEVHPAGRRFPSNGMPVVDLPWRNDDGGPGFQSDSVLWFDAPQTGRYLIRLRDVRQRGGDDFVYHLSVRPRREDFRVSLDPENPNVPRGGALPVNVTIERLDNFNGPVQVRLEGLPAGFTSSTTTIGPDLVNGVIQIAVAEDAAQPEGEAGMQWRAVATAIVDGQPVERTSTPAFGGHQLTITSPPDLVVDVQPRIADIEPGQQVRFTVTIERRNGFQGRVPVDVLNLPHGLQVLDVGLNGVLINENETSRAFVVACDPWAVGGDWPFFAAPRVESKNERHGSPVLRLHVKNVPGPAQ